MIGGIVFIPEAPSWYVRRGELDKARASLVKLYGKDQQDAVQAELEREQTAAEIEHAASTSAPGLLEPLQRVSCHHLNKCMLINRKTFPVP